jgi:pimeloyl-ACP methyl ester carboxylesterase
MPLSSVAPFLKALLLSAIGCKRAAVTAFLRMTLRGPDGASTYDSLDDETRQAVLENADILLHELKTGTGEEITAERLKQLHCPISAIVGEQTHRLFTEAVQRLSGMLPQMRVTHVPAAGHLLVLSHPATFAQLALQP